MEMSGAARSVRAGASWVVWRSWLPAGPRVMRLFGAAPLVLGCALLVLWVRHVQWVYDRFGLFNWLGVDFGYYYGQARAFWAGDPKAIYDRAVIDTYHRLLLGFVRDPADFPDGQVPYPPLYAWLFTPFAIPSPVIGLAAWTALNLVGAVWLAKRMAALFPAGARLWVAVLFLGSLPVVHTLIVGQPMLWLSCALAESFLALRAGRDLRAGLWLGGLLVKPHYALLLGAMLVWKRRWVTVAGGAIVAAAIAGGSVLVAGLPALLAYPSSILHEAQGFQGVYAETSPDIMINWRSLVLKVAPQIDDRTGIALTALLGAITILLVLPAWRGPWAPADRRFPGRMLLLLIATVLSSYHSHVPGAVLLAMPAAVVLAEGQPGWLTRAAIVAATVVPTLTLTLTGMSSIRLFTILLCVCYAGLLADLVPLPLRAHLPIRALLPLRAHLPERAPLRLPARALSRFSRLRRARSIAPPSLDFAG